MKPTIYILLPFWLLSPPSSFSQLYSEMVSDLYTQWSQYFSREQSFKSSECTDQRAPTSLWHDRDDRLPQEEPLYEIKIYHIPFSRGVNSIWAELLASLKSFHSKENKQVYCTYHNYILHDFLQLKSLLELASYSSREILNVII